MLYNFKGGRRADGSEPISGVTELNGLLYGTTVFGGLTGCDQGCGTAYSVSLAGVHTVLYRFKSGIDGAQPGVSLIYRNGLFFGTAGGGDYHFDGVVFKMDLTRFGGLQDKRRKTRKEEPHETQIRQT